MKTLLLFTFLFVSSFSLIGQIEFEKGYFINNKGEKIDCLIKNIDWKNTPSIFKYKLTEEAEEQKAGIETVTEFGIGEKLKFQRFEVEINKANVNALLSTSDKPILENKTLFLKVLMEGKANLYYYESGNLKHFFYSIENSNPKYLIFKKYKSGDYIRYNRSYIYQLSNNLVCQNLKTKEFNTFNYELKDMLSLFKKYNECQGSQIKSYNETKRTRLFNLTPRVGIRHSTFQPNSSFSSNNINDVTFIFGLEGEIIFPINRNKWSLILAPTFQQFSSDDPKVNYKSIELPLGIRHYIFLNKKSALYANSSVLFDTPIDEPIKSSNFTIRSISLSFGLGFVQNKKIRLEMLYGIDRNISDVLISSRSKYKTLSLVLGYTLF